MPQQAQTLQKAPQRPRYRELLIGRGHARWPGDLAFRDWEGRALTAEGLRAIAEHVGQFRTLTFDNGTEFHDYKTLEKHSGVTCYFATPYHSWERGSNENLNGLFRQYVPKGSCMKGLSQRRCDEIAHELNTRPRARHGFKTPLEVYYAS